MRRFITSNISSLENLLTYALVPMSRYYSWFRYSVTMKNMMLAIDIATKQYHINRYYETVLYNA